MGTEREYAHSSSQIFLTQIRPLFILEVAQMIWFFSEPKAAVQEFTAPRESEETKTEHLLGNTLTSLLKNLEK